MTRRSARLRALISAALTGPSSPARTACRRSGTAAASKTAWIEDGHDA
jgi:hypothetical protein